MDTQNIYVHREVTKDGLINETITKPYIYISNDDYNSCLYNCVCTCKTKEGTDIYYLKHDNKIMTHMEYDECINEFRIRFANNDRYKYTINAGNKTYVRVYNYVEIMDLSNKYPSHTIHKINTTSNTIVIAFSHNGKRIMFMKNYEQEKINKESLILEHDDLFRGTLFLHNNIIFHDPYNNTIARDKYIRSVLTYEEYCEYCDAR
jgi:hypothetical protein